MGRFLLRKLVFVIPTLIGASLVVFFALRVIPGDPIQALLGQGESNLTPEAITRIRHELGLDDPLAIQYLHFVGGLIHGDLGQSLTQNRSVLAVIGDVFPATVELALASFLVSCVLGIVAGIVSAARQYSLFDNILSVLVLIGVSMPNFWSALLVLLTFGLYLGWFPIGGAITVGLTFHRVTGMYVVDSLIQGNWAALRDTLVHLVLPAVTLGLGPVAIITRQMRSAMLEVLRQDYVTTARSKGLTERVVIVRHAVRNSLIPVVTVIGLELGSLLSGAVVIETIFARPGIGRLAVVSIGARDYPVVQGIVLLSVVAFVTVNLFVDVLYAFLDPRIKHA
jgi:peptide/nickel transport system permease protein